MPVRLVSVGDIDTIVKTTFQQTSNGMLHESITIDAPRNDLELQLVKIREREKVWESGLYRINPAPFS